MKMMTTSKKNVGKTHLSTIIMMMMVAIAYSALTIMGWNPSPLLVNALSFTGQPKTFPTRMGSSPATAATTNFFFSSSAIPTRSSHSRSRSSLMMISTGEDRSERKSLDISKTTYISLVKTPKDAYQAFAEKGKSNAQMHWLKILHQSILGGSYVGFGALLALTVAGNMVGSIKTNPGLVKMTFAALFPVNLLLIVMTSAQLFTGNAATVSAARWEGMVEWREWWKSMFVSLIGNIIGCAIFAHTAHYIGCLTGGTAAMIQSTAVAKCSYPFLPTMVKGILCNWMVSLALFMANASNDLPGKLVGCWFPISTFVGIGLEHSVANLFILPCAILLGGNLSIQDIVVKNLIPVLLGNLAAGGLVVAASYSFQFRNLGKQSRERFRKELEAYQARKQAIRDSINARKVLTEAVSAAASTD